MGAIKLIIVVYIIVLAILAFQPTVTNHAACMHIQSSDVCNDPLNN